MKQKEQIEKLEEMVKILYVLWWIHIIGSIISGLIALARYL